MREVLRVHSRWLVALLFACLLNGASSFATPTKSRRAYSLQHLGATNTEIETASDHATTIDKQALKEIESCDSGTRAQRILKQALPDNALYASVDIPAGASARGLSDGDLAIQTKIRNSKYSILELIELNGDKDADRASLAILSLMVASTTSALVANQNLPGPEIFRFIVVWAFSFAPLAFVGYGIATPEKLQTLLVSIQRNVFPTYRQRMIQHEAGHFLMAHLLGCATKGYATNAVKSAVEFYPLNDPEIGRDRVQALGFDRSTRRRGDENEIASVESNAPYFSEQGRGSDAIATQSVFRNDKNSTENRLLKLPSENEPTMAWPYRGFDENTIDKLTVVSVAGVCAEILAYGNAEGGYADISQLRQIFNSAEPELDERGRENRIRFALGYTMSQLRLHLGALDALAEVMENDGSIADCVLAIESCPNVSGQDGIMGDYEQRRKEQFNAQGLGVLERVLLGGRRNADVEEDRLVQGKGGGYIREKFEITGDDPLYLALAVSSFFVLWASSGGLSLH